jgi:hypothetical protein
MCHVVEAVRCPKGDSGAPPPLMWSSLWDPLDRRKDLSAQGLDVPVGGELPAPAVHDVQLLAAVALATGVGVSSENVLEDPLGRLIPEVPLSRGHITVVDPLLARPTTRWGAILGSLLAWLADVLRELDDIATLRGAVVTVGVHRAWAAIASLWPWALVALILAPSRSCNDQSSRLRPLVAVVLLFLFAVLGDGTQATRLGNPSLRCLVPCTTLGSSSTLVS